MLKTKRVFLVHGWDGRPDNHWFPWLKKELEDRKFKVESLTMPDPGKPKIKSWIDYLSREVGIVDEETFFVGHSMGCQAILRFLEKLSVGKKIGGAVFVGGFFVLTNFADTDEDKKIAKPWIENPINFEKVKQHTNKLAAIFSDDDPVVPLNNKDLFEDRLGAKIIIEHNKGHFCKSDGVVELPSILEAVLEISGNA